MFRWVCICKMLGPSSPNVPSVLIKQSAQAPTSSPDAHLLPLRFGIAGWLHSFGEDRLLFCQASCESLVALAPELKPSASQLLSTCARRLLLPRLALYLDSSTHTAMCSCRAAGFSAYQSTLQQASIPNCIHLRLLSALLPLYLGSSPAWNSL